MTSQRRGIMIIAIANGLLMFGYGLSLPFFTIYLITQQGLSVSLAGLMIALAGLSRSVSSGLSGEMSDVFGRKKVMVWALLCQTVAMLALGTAIALKAEVGWVLICYFLTCFLGAFFRPASNAWIADNATAKGRVEAFGINRIGLNLGWALGPAAGGFLVRYSYSLAFFLTAISYFLVVLFLVKYIVDTHKPVKTRKTNFISLVLSLKDIRLAKLCFFVLLITAVNSQLVVGLSVHCKQFLAMPEHYIGWFFTINGAVVVLFQYAASRLMARMRLTTAMLWGCLLYAVGFGSVGFFDSFTLIALGVFMSAVGELVVSPGEHALVSNIAAPQLRGRYLGMLMVFYNLGASVGFFGAGMLSEYVAPHFLPGPWLLVGLVAVLAGVGFYSMRHSLNAEEDGKTNIPIPIKKDTMMLN